MYAKLEKHNINGIEQTIVVLCADEGKLLHRKKTNDDLMKETWLIDGSTVDDYEETKEERKEG